MIRRLILIALVLCIYGFAQYDTPRPRFEMLLNEPHPEGGTRVHSIEVWHDKESGDEITCVNTDGFHEQALSCFKTGRNWK